MGACGGLGSCGACGEVQPLPAGGLPVDQTVEGGAQIRVTPAGFNKLTSILPGLFNDQLSEGFCVPRGEVGDADGFLGTGAFFCNGNVAGCSPGCQVDVSLNSLTPTVTNQNLLNLQLSTSVATTVNISGQVIGIGFSCSLNISSNNLGGNVDIGLGIRPDSGELELNLANINSFTTNFDFSGCGPLSDIGNFVSEFLDSFVGQFIIDLLTPTINDILQDLLPSPLGIAGMLDANSLVAGISPGTDAGSLEARIVPGGYVNLIRNGMSLGVITGLNADYDPATRAADLDSQPALCVPALPAPDFAAAPASLPRSIRNTFSLGVANEFNGLPSEPSADVAMGISETTLDLAGHHITTSGLMCLGVGTSFISQLTVGTVAILVPSLGEVTSAVGNDPLLLVTRPQRALDFSIGDNTPASPALTIGIRNLEVDFYAFLFDRYVRVFTLELTLDVGLGLEPAVEMGVQVLKPTLVGLSSENVTVKALNTEFVRESPAELEQRLPTIFDLVTPLLGNLPSIPVPSFAGFTLEDLTIAKVTTAQDDFLALNAKLGASAMMRQLAARDPFAADAVAALDAATVTARDVPMSTGTARLLRVSTPEPAAIRSALDAQTGALPQVVITADAVDTLGRTLEWSYNLDGGLWRTFQRPVDGKLVIADRAFAWQGKYSIGLRSRAVGSYQSTSSVSQIDVVIDSAPPQIYVDKLVEQVDSFEIPVFDVVYETDVSYAFGKPGTDEQSRWIQGNLATLSRTDAQPFLVDGELVVYARDPKGNTTMVLVAPFHGQPSESGCNCDASGVPTPGGFVIAGIVGLFILAPRLRRRRKMKTLAFARWASISIAVSMFPGCSCGDPAGQAACEVVEDCEPCEEGQLAQCIDGQCACDADILPGRIGPYSDIARAGDGTVWVSAYAETHGDLVVAKTTAGRIPDTTWEWVDGVPDVDPSVPGSGIRNGISQAGEDVGMYTSIGVNANGEPMVSYFDRDTASLRFAMKQGDTWTTHVVEAGTGVLNELGGSLIGMYTSMSVRSDDGRPGIAYLAHISDAGVLRAEVRFAGALVTNPTSASDWQVWIVDSAPLELDPADIYPLPQGMGLFVDSTRLPDQSPVVAYYDRSNGDLKLATFDTSSGRFGAAVVLAGSDGTDAGWTPSVSVDGAGMVHVAFVSTTGDDLQWIANAPNAVPELIDDGYRVVGVTVDNLPKPEFHFVGDDATLVFAGSTPMVAYQDATTQELLLATRQPDGTWERESVAGNTDPWPGAYGFYAAAAFGGTEIVMSTWVVNQPESDNWVEVFSRTVLVR